MFLVHKTTWQTRLAHGNGCAVEGSREKQAKVYDRSPRVTRAKPKAREEEGGGGRRDGIEEEYTDIYVREKASMENRVRQKLWKCERTRGIVALFPAIYGGG